MIDPNTICNITNRSPGSVLYTIPEQHIRREFNRGETKRVPYSEIMAVASQAGGRELLYNYFYVQEIEVVEEALNVRPEVEYYLTEDRIPGWIKSCTIDEFKDALDFAPEGVKNLIKQLSVTLPLNDVEKREALKEQLGFDCEAAIRNEKATREEDNAEETRKEAQRRVETPSAMPSKPVRRVIKKKES